MTKSFGQAVDLSCPVVGACERPASADPDALGCNASLDLAQQARDLIVNVDFDCNKTIPLEVL